MVRRMTIGSIQKYKQLSMLRKEVRSWLGGISSMAPEAYLLEQAVPYLVLNGQSVTCCVRNIGSRVRVPGFKY